MRDATKSGRGHNLGYKLRVAVPLDLAAAAALAVVVVWAAVARVVSCGLVVAGWAWRGCMCVAGRAVCGALLGNLSLAC